MSALKLRLYQQTAIDAVYDYWRHGGGNPLVEMATGTGKSVVIGEMLRRLHEGKPSRRFLVLTHVKELIEQDAGAVLAVWPDAPIGIHSAGLGARDVDAPVVVAGVQSVFRNPEILGPRHLVVVDEAHLIPRSGDGMYRQTLERLRALAPEMRVAGFTATPYRLDSGRLDEGDGRLFDKIVYSYDLRDGVQDGFLAALVGRATDAEIDVRGISRRGGEFVAGELEWAADKVVADAVSEIVERGEGRRSWLAFCSGVAHAEHVRDEMHRRGIPAATVTGQTPAKQRAEIFAAFRAGRIRALTGANVFTTGFDAPAVDLIAMLRPTLSTGLYVQMLGRGTRKTFGKATCEVLDFAGNVRRHGPVDAVSVATKDARAVKPDDVRAKACPECRAYVAMQATRCDACGHTWPRKQRGLKHAAIAESVPIMSRDMVWLSVHGIGFAVHRKPEPGSRPTLRVTYQTGASAYSEFIAFEHDGYARQRAAAWWRELGGDLPAPSTCEAALARRQELAPVGAIAIGRAANSTWWEVRGRRLRRSVAAGRVLTEARA